jgi:hypothetical protein
MSLPHQDKRTFALTTPDSNTRQSGTWIRLVVLVLALTQGLAEETQATAEQRAFFEAKIRPVLVEHCYQCHSTTAKENKKLKGGLYLDTRAGVLTGGDTGPALVPGMPDKSLLMTAIRWQDQDIEMPPKNKLPDAVIADFATWIATGATDPRDGPAPLAKPVIDIAKGRQHWAFTPLMTVKPPEVKNVTSVRTPVDRFILARQEAAGITPSAPVSRDKLIRRASFALLGLPPTWDEVASFVADPAPDAYATLLDRMLANPAFGERWSRHWLDAVRFAESGGYEFDKFRPGSYQYRDWVIRSLNADLPYDQFVRKQIAGDLLTPQDFNGACATGFLVAGPYPGQLTAKTKERIRYDQLDDMVSTIGSSMLGLTIGCARCHDHKFDPLPQQDYYAMAAALAKTQHKERKIDPKEAESRIVLAEHAKKGKPLHEALKQFQERDLPMRFAAWRKDALPSLSAQLNTASRWQAFSPVSAEALSAELEVNPDGHVLNTGKREMKDVYTVKAMTYQSGLTAFRIDVFAGDEFPNKGPGLSANGNFVLGDIKIIARARDTKLKAKPLTVKLKAGTATFEQKDYALSSALDNSPDSGWGVAPNVGKNHSAIFTVDGPAIGFVGGTDLEFELTFDHFGVGKLQLSFAVADHPADPPTDADKNKHPLPPPAIDTLVEAQDTHEIVTVLQGAGDPVAEAELRKIQHWYLHFDQEGSRLAEAVRKHEQTKPKPNLITVYTTTGGGQDVYFLRRGEVDNKDTKSNPAYFQVLQDADVSRWQMKADTDPRLGLGRWLTDAEAGAGRLLARVMVNRVWKHLFGHGLVATPNDFGLQGERPTHPELLDYLANELIRGGWKLKPLMRQIMLSAVYLQGADERENNRTRDPENKLWWQHPAMRLEAEIIRDSLLSVSGNLDRTMFGPSIENFSVPRRGVYLRVRRSELFPFFVLFDAPEATQSIGDRGTTTQPTQALAMMNSPFVNEAADALCKTILTPGTSFSDAVTRAYRTVLSRNPSANEVDKMTAFWTQEKMRLGANQTTATVDAHVMTRICKILLCLNEFIYVD